MYQSIFEGTIVTEFSKVEELLEKKYELNMQEILQMTTGVGGETYKICTNNGHFIFKGIAVKQH